MSKLRMNLNSIQSHPLSRVKVFWSRWLMPQKISAIQPLWRWPASRLTAPRAGPKLGGLIGGTTEDYGDQG